MKLKKIIRATSYYDLTPYDESELIEEVKNSMEHIIVSLVTADIKVTSAMFKMAAKKDLLGLLKLIPNVTEQAAAYIIDGSIIGFNLQEGMFDEAIESAKDLKLFIEQSSKGKSKGQEHLITSTPRPDGSILLHEISFNKGDNNE